MNLRNSFSGAHVIWFKNGAEWTGSAEPIQVTGQAWHIAGCVFRGNPAGYSDGKRPPFRAKPATHSDGKAAAFRPVVGKVAGMARKIAG